MVLLAVLAIFIAICFVFPGKVGIVGYGLATGFFGLFGMAAFLVPVLMVQVAYFWKRDVISGAIRYKYIVAISFLLLCAVIIHTFRSLALHEEITFAGVFTWERFKTLFSDGREYQGGGLIGGLLSLLMICAFGYPGTLIFGFLFLIFLGMALFGLTPSECAQRFAVYQQRNREERKIRREERAIARAIEKEEAKKRALAAAADSETYDDEEEDYKDNTKKDIFDSVFDCMLDGAEAGSELGAKLLGIPGRIIGGVVGGLVGSVVGVIESVFGI